MEVDPELNLIYHTALGQEMYVMISGQLIFLGIRSQIPIRQLVIFLVYLMVIAYQPTRFLFQDEHRMLKVGFPASRYSLHIMVHFMISDQSSCLRRLHLILMSARLAYRMVQSAWDYGFMTTNLT